MAGSGHADTRAPHGLRRVQAGRRFTKVGQVAMLPSALPAVAFVPYAGAVPDGGRRGFEAAVAVRAPIV
jgi:hypothetical protein